MKGVKKEMDIIRKALKKDKGYYESWVANIAMAFKDEHSRCKKKYKTRQDIHDIANTAAKYFLNNLINF